MFKDLIKLARPYQYTKNLFVFLPAFFAFELSESDVLFNGTLAFIAFSLVASSVYILNDWVDKDDDRRHPEKKNRPIASGRVSGVAAFIFFTALVIPGAIIGYSVSLNVFLLLVVYFSLNLAYSLKLKHVPLLDITVIAAGFVLRLFVGSNATSVELSHWIIVITFLLALFLALAKRRDDVLIYLETNRKPRKVTDGYNLPYLNSAMSITSSIVIIAYILWSITPEVTERLNSNNVYITSIFVFLGISRYMQITFVEEKSSNPSDVLIRDRFLQLILLSWFLMFIYILYL